MDKLTFDHRATESLQDPRTAVCTFGPLDDNDEPLFQVRAGVKAETALAQLALLLKCAHESAYELTDNGCGCQGLVWSVVQAVESAQALLDAVLKGATHKL